MRILTAKDVRAAITMPEAIQAVRAGFIALSAGKAEVPLRTVLHTPDGLTLYMPAYIQGEPVSTVKVVSVYAQNPARGLPTINAAVLVLDATTGVPVAMMEGATLTALRTGAASGLATDLLAKKDAHVLGVIGAGAQARTQIEAVCAVRAIQQIRIFSLAGAEKMAEELRSVTNAEIVIAGTAHEALQHADVIATATNTKWPVVHAADVSPGAHINGIGSFTPEMQEIASDVVAKAKIVVDHRHGAWAEAGDLIIPRNQGLISENNIHAEIGEIAAGLRPGRVSADEITFFKSVGNAVQDAVVARRVIDAAEARGLGTWVTL